MRGIVQLNIGFALLILSTSHAAAAKQDIRGVTLGMTRDQLKEVLTKSGAACNDIGYKALCYFNDGSDRNGIEVDFNSAGRAFKMSYVFNVHASPEQIRKSIISQYDLKPVAGSRYYTMGSDIGADIDFMGNRGKFFIMKLNESSFSFMIKNLPLLPMKSISAPISLPIV